MAISFLSQTLIFYDIYVVINASNILQVHHYYLNLPPFAIICFKDTGKSQIIKSPLSITYKIVKQRRKRR